MRSSNQIPLTASMGRSEHDFTQSAVEWEAAVFDNAAYFSVVETRAERRRSEFVDLPTALAYARNHAADGACLYAVCGSGRSTLLDPEKWSEWEQRWGRLAATRSVSTS